MTALVVAASLLVLAVLSARRSGPAHPVSLTLGIWIVALVINGTDILRLREVSDLALLVILAGLVSLFAGSLLSTSRKDISAVSPRIRRSAYFLTLSLLCSLYIVGILHYRSAVEQAAGTSWGNIDKTLVRYYETNFLSGSIGYRGTLISLGPLVVCVALYGARLGIRYGLLAIPIVVAGQLHSQSRTGLFTILLVPLLFSIYTSVVNPNKLDRPRMVTLRSAALLVVVGGSSLLVFSLTTDSLGKSTTDSPYYRDALISEPFRSPALYVAGGTAALSEALDERINPTDGSSGKSVFVIYRAARSVGILENNPTTIASFVQIPGPFNVYTGFGDIWFDFGWAGVLLLPFCFGALVHLFWRHASMANPGYAVGAAALTAALVTSPISMRVLNIDTVIHVIAGGVAFYAFSEPSALGDRAHRDVAPKGP
jgi:oligosaccharide repeat unit polymerase